MTNRIVLLTGPLVIMCLMGCTEDATVTGSSTNEPSSDASISAVIPNKVYLGRTVDVTVSGFGTKWTEATKVDFGEEIAVLDQTVASPTAIVATIEINENAKVGARDVIVIDAAGTSTYKGAFKLDSPLALSFSGALAQGSILVTKAKLLDLATPFDTTATGDGFFEPYQYPNVRVTGSPGIAASVEALELYFADLLVTVDVDVPEGKADLTVHSGPLGEVLASPAPGSIDVAARMPEILTEGASVKSSVDEPLGTLLYKFTPPVAGLYSITAEASSSDANPNLAVLPKSGRFAQIMDFSANPTIQALNSDPFYFVYWDNSGDSGYMATLSAKKIEAADVEPNDTCATAQPAGALPAEIMSLFMANEKDVDWFSFDVQAADVGNIVHVKTSPGDTKTDTVIQVFASNCTTALGSPSSDASFHEDLKSAPITAAGKHYVMVKNSQYGYTGKLYNLSIAVEAPPPPAP